MCLSTDNFYRSHICSILLRMTQKTRHSTAKTLIVITMQKLRSYTQHLTHYDMPKLDYIFLYTLYNKELYVQLRRLNLNYRLHLCHAIQTFR